MLNNYEIIQYLNSRKIILWRLSGNTNDLKIAKENINKINCILIMEKFNDEITIFQDYLNNKFKNNFTLNTSQINQTNYNNILEYNQEKDIVMIFKHSNVISAELELYYYIFNMNITDRYK